MAVFTQEDKIAKGGGSTATQGKYVMNVACSLARSTTGNALVVVAFTYLLADGPPRSTLSGVWPR